MKEEKFIVYQLLPRIFGNINRECIPDGSLEENGTGKFSDITDGMLEEIKKLSVSHIWYTGVIEHATKTDFTRWGIRKDHPLIVKGEAGSPYAIKDYYDVNPYLADDPRNRMKEFEALVERTHRAGCKVIIDFVPNHLARGYRSDSRPEGVEEFGESDNKDVFFDPQNNFYYLPGTPLDVSRLPGYAAFCQAARPSGEPGPDGPASSCGDAGEVYREYPARATGNDCFSSAPGGMDWYETVKLNYGVDPATGASHFDPVPRTWKMMLEVLLFWADKKVDGFRCDMAEMVPAEFWHWAISRVKESYPEIVFIAEIYKPSLYGTYVRYGGFDYLYDKVGLYDMLKSVSRSASGLSGRGEGVHDTPASFISRCWQELGDLQPRMLNFLENHDEQRIASDFNLGNAFGAVPELAVSLMLNKAPFMVYAGQEFGERGMSAEGFSKIDGRTSIFDYCSVPSLARFVEGFRKNECLLTGEEREIYEIYKCLLRIAMREDAVRYGYTYDLEYANMDTPGFDPRRRFVFARRAGRSAQDPEHREEVVLVAADFAGTPGEVSVKLPRHFFQAWNIEPGKEYMCRDLLSGPLFSCGTAIARDASFTMRPEYDGIIVLPVKKYGISVMKFTLD